MQDLITFLMLQIPVFLLVFKCFKIWSKSMTFKMHQKYGGDGYCGISVKRLGITLYYLPYNSKTAYMAPQGA